MGDRAVVDLAGLAGRVGCNADRLASDAGDWRDFLPKCFGDERNDRMGQPQNRLQRANQGAAGGALLGLAAGLDLHLRDFQVPVAELVPGKVVDCVGDVVEPVFCKALGHVGLDNLELGRDPTVGLAESHIAVKRTGRLDHSATGVKFGRAAFGLGVLLQPAILAFAVHQHEAGGVPQLVAKVAVPLAPLAVKVDAAPERCQCRKRESQRIGAVGGYAVRKLFFGFLAHLGCGFGLAQSGGALVQQRCQRDAINQVHRVQHIAFGFAHLAALRVPHQSVDIDVFERHLAGEVGGHHDHPGHPEKDDVVAGDQHTAGQV